MQVNFTSFNYKAADIAGEERHYFDYHVDLAKKLPGLRFYLTGKFRAHPSVKPPHYRAAILAFDSAEGAASAMSSDAGRTVREDGAAHLTGARPLALDAQVIVPFDSRQPGRDCFLMAAEFDLETASAGLEAADRRYLEQHTALARQLPGLRLYMTGRLFETRGLKPDRWRCAMLAFDNLEALRAAYRSPVGQDLIKDEEATIRNARVHRIDARVEI
ncbi:MAG: EthD family reductase [Candidatus Binataceae bacterium]